MALGLFTLIHDEIKGPLIKDKYFSKEIDISPEFISKLYLSHAGFEESSLLEIKLNQYKVVSYYTGQKARIHKAEGILAILLEGDENIENLELFLAKNIGRALKLGIAAVLEKILAHHLPHFAYLTQYVKKHEIENITEIFILKGKDTLESVLFYFGKAKPSYEEFGALYNKANFDEDTPGIVWETLSQEKSHYYLGIRHEKNTPDIEKVAEVLAGYLSKSLYHCLEIIMMILFPQSTLLVNLQELSSIDFTSEPLKLTKEILTSSIKVQEQLNKAANYHSVFESFMAGLFQDELYAIPKP